MSRIVDLSVREDVCCLSGAEQGRLARGDWGPLVGAMPEGDLLQCVHLGDPWSRSVALLELARREALER